MSQTVKYHEFTVTKTGDSVRDVLNGIANDVVNQIALNIGADLPFTCGITSTGDDNSYKTFVVTFIHRTYGYQFKLVVAPYSDYSYGVGTYYSLRFQCTPGYAYSDSACQAFYNQDTKTYTATYTLKTKTVVIDNIIYGIVLRSESRNIYGNFAPWNGKLICAGLTTSYGKDKRYGYWGAAGSAAEDITETSFHVPYSQGSYDSGWSFASVSPGDGNGMYWYGASSSETHPGVPQKGYYWLPRLWSGYYSNRGSEDTISNTGIVLWGENKVMYVLYDSDTHAPVQIIPGHTYTIEGETFVAQMNNVIKFGDPPYRIYPQPGEVTKW